MLTRRLIVCLDVEDGRVVKGVNFTGLRDVGDPVALAERYEAEGADEITFLDITATHEARATLFDLARRTAERLFIPLTIGGGIRTADDMAAALRAGADKVSVNSAAVRTPEIITRGAARFGAQCVVASIDAKWDGERYRVQTAGGAGDASHICEAITDGLADAALVAGILHDGVTTVGALKATMRLAALPVREVAA